MSDAPDPAVDSERAVDAVLAEFNGNARAAIAALIHDLDVLARDSVMVSRGLMRRARVLDMPVRREPKQG